MRNLLVLLIFTLLIGFLGLGIAAGLLWALVQIVSTVIITKKLMILLLVLGYAGAVGLLVLVVRLGGGNA